MRITTALKVYSSLVRFKPLNLAMYHIPGRPRRLLRDDGTEYNLEKNITPKQDDVRRQLDRLERLEKLQTTGHDTRSGRQKRS